jgi:hypothetical protein
MEYYLQIFYNFFMYLLLYTYSLPSHVQLTVKFLKIGTNVVQISHARFSLICISFVLKNADRNCFYYVMECKL